MANNNRRDDRRDDRDEGDNEPWNAFELREREKRDRSGKPTGEKETRWVLCGTAWPFREGTGFNIDLDWDIKKGSRIQIMPRKSNDRR